MPTVKLDINTGLDHYSPSDSVDSLVKLHNFIVGGDGSLYKMPALKNLKNQEMHRFGDSKKYVPGILNLKKLETIKLPLEKEKVEVGEEETIFYNFKYFRRFVFRTIFSIGMINIDYERNLVTNADLQKSLRISSVPLIGSYEKDIQVRYKGEGLPPLTKIPLSFLKSELQTVFLPKRINVESEDGDFYFEKLYQAVFFQPISTEPIPENFNFPVMPVAGSLIASEVVPLLVFHPPFLAEEPEANPTELVAKWIYPDTDTVVGGVVVGNRYFFYSLSEKKIYISVANHFFNLMGNPDQIEEPYVIEPSDVIEGMTEFNGDLITFSSGGMDRWVWNPGTDSGDKRLILQDPSFHYQYRCRFSGSWVVANKDLYFYTDTMEVYVLRSNLSVEPVFQGKLPLYNPFKKYFEDPSVNHDSSLNMTSFKLLGYRFISLGPWLYNLDTKTWSTYSFDGWKKPEENPDPLENYIWENDLSRRLVQQSVDDIVCTYSTICAPMTYKEMDSYFTEHPDAENTLVEGEAQWGNVSFFCTRIFQQLSTFSIDGVLAYTRGGTLRRGDKLYLRILTGDSKGEDFDEDDPSTWGIPASYEPKPGTTNTGQFRWHDMSVKAERFRVQITTNIKRPVVIQSVFANLTLYGENGPQQTPAALGL